jgi:hypothetical protein
MAIATHYLFTRLRMHCVGGMTFIHLPLWDGRKIVISVCCSHKW